MMEKGVKGDQGEPGDSGGHRPIDPTKNVLDLVKAESKYQDAMRDSLKEKLGESHAALKEQLKEITSFVVLFQNAQRDSETRRIDQLASTRQEFSNTIRDMLAESVRTTSTLVSTQLVQIQATFDTRVSKLEAFQFTQAGRSSVADPALSDALIRMTTTLTELRSTQDASIARNAAAIATLSGADSRAGGLTMGRGEASARTQALIMMGAAVAGPIIAVIATLMAMRGR